MDAVVVGDGSVSALLGDGTGSLQLASTQTLATTISSAALGDLDGDGRLDLIVMVNGGQVGVMSGDGAGGLGTFTPVLSTSGFKMAVGDFNEDGRADLAILDEDQFGHASLTPYLSQPGGGFQAMAAITVVDRPGPIAVADVNRDGHLDVVVAANFAAIQATVLLGDGHGAFQPSTVAMGNCSAETLNVGDFNGDGDPDLLISGYPPCTQVQLGFGDGGFGPPISSVSGGNFASAAVGDFDCDGDLDFFAVGQGNTSNGNVYRGRGDGTFDLVSTGPLHSQAIGSDTADFDGDGYLDVVAVNHDSNDVTLLVGNAPQPPANPPVCAPGAMLSSPESLQTGSDAVRSARLDMNGDGIPDLVTGNGSSVSLLPGLSDGGYGRWTSKTVPGPAQGYLFLDLNGDGRPDIAHTVYDYSNNLGALDVAYALADGGLAQSVSIPLPTAPFDLAPADLDGDGRPDLIISEINAGALALFRNLGDGGFASAAVLNTGGAPTSLATGTLARSGTAVVAGDDDGHVFVISAPPGGSWWLTDGGSGASVLALPSGHVSAVTLGDVNNDGQLDILATSGDAFLSDDGGWTHVSTGAQGENIVAGDLDGDGNLDMVTSSYSDGVVTVFKGAGDGGFSSVQTIPAGVAQHQLGLYDENGDGRLELEICNRFQSTVDVRFSCSP